MSVSITPQRSRKAVRSIQGSQPAKETRTELLLLQKESGPMYTRVIRLYLDPNSKSSSPKALNIAQEAILLHTFRNSKLGSAHVYKTKTPISNECNSPMGGVQVNTFHSTIFVLKDHNQK